MNKQIVDEVFHSAGRLDYGYATGLNAKLKLSPFFWQDLKSLLGKSKGLDVLVHLVILSAQKDYDDKKSKLKPNALHIQHVLEHVIHRTVRYNKLCELIAHGDIEDGRPEQFLFGEKVKTSSIRNAMYILYEQNILIKANLTSTYSGTLTFLNVPLVLEVLHDYYFRHLRKYKVSAKTPIELPYAIQQATTLFYFWGKYFEGDFKKFIESVKGTDPKMLDPRSYRKDWNKKCEVVVKLPAQETAELNPTKDYYYTLKNELYPVAVKDYVVFEGYKFSPWFFKDYLVLAKLEDIEYYSYENASAVHTLKKETKAALAKYFPVTPDGPKMTDEEIDADYIPAPIIRHKENFVVN